MGKAVTLKEVAQRAGVSTATVSHVLNNKKSVTPDVYSRVQHAVASTGYRMNTAARALRTGRSKTLGLLIPDIANPFFPQLIKAVEARAKQEGYALVLFESGYEAQTERRGLAFLETQRVDGVIWVLSASDRLPARPHGLPTVVLDYAPHDWFAVRADDYEGGRLQARHAMNLGHTHALAVWGHFTVTSIRERRRGFLDEAAGRLTLIDELEAPFFLELGGEAQTRLLSQRGAYSFVVCGNDVLAIAVMRTLKAAGLRIPQEVSVIGFDDTPLCPIVDPPLSSIGQSVSQLGALAVEGLLQQLRPEPARPHQIIVPVNLEARGSTGPAPAGAGQ